MPDFEKRGINALPSGHADRDAVARQIRLARGRDRGREWNRDRLGVHYLDCLDGVSGTLAYVKAFGKTKVVLDIGTGSGQALHEIAKSSLGIGLVFKATALTRSINHPRVFAAGQLKMTSAEVLRGVPPASIDLILAVRSIGYSEHPEHLIDRLDQVLTEGGVIKVAFRREEDHTFEDEKVSHLFVRALQARGYDVAVQRDEEGNQTGLVLAQKFAQDSLTDPPRVTADELLRRDHTQRERDMQHVPGGIQFLRTVSREEHQEEK